MGLKSFRPVYESADYLLHPEFSCCIIHIASQEVNLYPFSYANYFIRYKIEVTIYLHITYV